MRRGSSFQSRPPIGGLSLAFEVHFMVAQSLDEPARNPQPQTRQEKWTCPKGSQDPCGDIMRRCMAVLSANGCDSRIVRRHAADMEKVWETEFAATWLLKPSSRPKPSDYAPAGYKWHGFKLRTPFFYRAEALSRRPLFMRCLAGLQDAVLLHLNSSCQLNVSVASYQHLGHLTEAKKLTTLVWLLEKQFLLILCPRVPLLTGRSMLTTDHSRLAKGSRSPVQRQAPVSIRHDAPRFRDSALDAQMQRLWACSSLKELEELLCRADNGEPLAFSIVQDELPSNPNRSSGTWKAVFRYAVWHPHKGVDVTEAWLRLLSAFLAAAQAQGRYFNEFATQTEEMTTWLDQAHSTEDERLPALLQRFGLRNDEQVWQAARRLYAGSVVERAPRCRHRLRSLSIFPKSKR
ncbi:hypothetical protein VFPFJ_04678 [Purpureocillium lilacinum]|uniref:Uncharacterized protein n=2 Tax=Purpureocillium lilacinum TaxID=33203 RepID=A0A179HLG9_PURLI|nr:hypothetical protein VFPFJ_04678 [Purpureocillium lilacinum]OAQ83738.1 hypothetical protein VFPBJ_02506 [Purpureocillium lilacinum]OAQ90518.1 hypothetical protein VFPFJ_04678 [Purpureocillium lilacinum]PWI68759.1 hypothetical protein PCL_01848 [Purpureocillium lilacinum]GJN78245.1 hypothetical protein PLIIFM63780_001738 [Purpureocillium lilacinum]